MSDDATLREINAVDSENKKNLLIDGWRMNQLQKHLCSKDHPYHKFSTGNWETLKVRPNAKEIDTRLELLKFYHNNYSANLMQLVVYAKEDLESIQKLVESKFKEVRNISRNPFSFPGQPCPDEHLQILVKAVPIKEGQKLEILWPITPNIQHYKEGPCKYLSHLIGHEGEGSLFFVLKNLGWALSLYAGEGESSLDFSFFSLTIELTDAGHEHVEEIIGLVFKYVKLLQESGVQKWIFDEIVAIQETGFHYRDKRPPSGYVVSVSTNMQFYPPEDWLVASSLLTKYSPEIIKKLISELSPSNVRIFWESKKFEGLTDSKEPWYDTSYSIEKLDISTLQNWIEKAPNENLSLPNPNLFIPTDLSLKNSEEKIKYPKMVRKSEFSRLWYKPDSAFLTPKVYIKIDFNCPESNHSPDALVLTNFFTELLMDNLNSYAYDADVAGLSYYVQNTDTGFEVTLVGYNHKMRILLDTIIAKISKFEVQPDRFYVIKEKIKKSYENYKFRPPYSQAMYYCNLILQDQTWPWNEELHALQNLTPQTLNNFLPFLLSKSFLECYIAGNLESSEAEEIVDQIEEVLFRAENAPCRALFASQHATKRIVKLENGLKYQFPAEGLNPEETNSALIYVTQVHQDDIKMNMKLELIAMISKQPAFHQLRSVEQLGYICLLRARNDHGVQGLHFIIQSTVKDPSYLEARADAFLTKFESTLYEMSDEEFKSNIKALIEMKQEKHKNLREESLFFWEEISQGTLLFDRKETAVAALKELQKEEIIEFFDKYIKINAPQRRALSVQVYGGPHSADFKKFMESPSQPDTCQIKDIFAFRRSRSLYGSFKGGVGHMKL